MIKYLAMVLLMAFCTSCSIRESALPVEVIIFAGQSNMVGSALIEDAAAGLFPLPDTIEFHDFSRTAYYVRTDGRFGPEASFAAALAKANPNKRYLFIKWAVGGSSLAAWSPDWTAESVLGTEVGDERAMLWGSLYEKSLADIRSVLEDRDVQVSGLLWMQGEVDSKRLDTAQNYATNMARLIAAFRHDLDAPELRVLLGLINPEPPRFAFVEEVQSQMRTLAAADPLVDVVSADGLQKLDDGIHYDHLGQIELGKRFAAKWLVRNEE